MKNEVVSWYEQNKEVPDLTSPRNNTRKQTTTQEHSLPNNKTSDLIKSHETVAVLIHIACRVNLARDRY